jgi:hypothetical protein
LFLGEECGFTKRGEHVAIAGVFSVGVFTDIKLGFCAIIMVEKRCGIEKPFESW